MAVMLARIGLVLLFTGLPASAHAHWNAPTEVIHSTAFTLEEGEFIFGLLSPIAYGARDTVTIVTHPVMWLLLTPNAGVRWRLTDAEAYSGAFVIDATQTLSTDGESSAQLDPRPAGQISTGFVGSFIVGSKLIVSANVGYRRDSSPDADMFAFSGSLSLLLSPAHMLLLQGGSAVSLADKSTEPTTAMLLYVHAWDSVRASVGLAYGRFPIVLGNNEEPVDVPVWPVLDLWWRF
jgi:hypothetical protein